MAPFCSLESFERTNDEDSRVLHVRLNTDFTDADMAFEPRIF